MTLKYSKEILAVNWPQGYNLQIKLTRPKLNIFSSLPPPSLSLLFSLSTMI